MPELNLPWRVEKGPHWQLFPWLVLDKWHVVIGRFEFAEHAHAAVERTNAYQKILDGLRAPDALT